MARKNYSFAHIHDDKYYASAEVARDVQLLTDTLEIIFDSASMRRKAVEINSQLTGEGKSVARNALKVEIKQAREGWLKTLTPLDDQISQIEKETVLTSHRPDDVVAALREQEMRVEIRKMDPVDIEIAYKQAAKNGDDLFVLAVENSPLPFNLKDDLVAKVRAARLERKFPEQAAMLKDLKLGRENLQSALRSVESDFRAQGIEIAEDPVSNKVNLMIA